MYAKIEPSGCGVRHGMVEIRICFYLEPDDYGYDKHYVNVVDVSSPEYLAGYKGKVNEIGQPIDYTDYKKWLDTLPHVWQNNPFHNHFIKVEPDTTDNEIQALAKSYLEEAYIKWATGVNLADPEATLKNHGKTREWNDAQLTEEWSQLDFGNLSKEEEEKVESIQIRIDACIARVESVKNMTNVIRIK